MWPKSSGNGMSAAVQPNSCRKLLAALLLFSAPRAGHAAATRFDLNEIRVEGSSVLPQDDVEQTIYPFLGPDRTASDVEHACAALEAAYQKAGFATVSVTIPPQSISQSGGVVVVQVIERRVERLRVTGARYFLPSAVRAGARLPWHRARCRT